MLRNLRAADTVGQSLHRSFLMFVNKYNLGSLKKKKKKQGKGSGNPIGKIDTDPPDPPPPPPSLPPPPPLPPSSHHHQLTAT